MVLCSCTILHMANSSQPLDLINETPWAVRDVGTHFGIHPDTVAAWPGLRVVQLRPRGLRYTTREEVERVLDRTSQQQPPPTPIGTAAKRAMAKLDEMGI